MRKSFLGVYEIDGSESSLSDIQRAILERLAIARTRGIAQNDLTNELGCPANKLFYPLKRLETQGLIIRQPTVIKKKKVIGSRDPNNCQIISTNTLYLGRYAKHLGCQRRLEITMEDNVPINGQVLDGNSEAGDDFNKVAGEGDVHVKDFLPAMKAICDKLEKAKGKVLVISDLKRDLGYHGKHAHGHRAWRNICHRLKDARLIEECSTMINNKETKCVRLLQSFSPSHFEAKHLGRGHYNDDEGQPNDFSKRGQITEQLVEVPILTQIYDMIDAAGPEGLTNTEVCRRLGLCAKEYHKRYFQQMISRFGMHLQPEGQNRGEVYRVWTPGNYKQPSNMQAVGKGNVRANDNESSSLELHGNPRAKFPSPAQGLDTSALVVEAERIKTTDRDVVVIDEPAEGTKADGEISPNSLFQGSGQNSDGVLVEEPLKVTAPLTNDQIPKKHAVSYSRKRLNPRYPRVTVAAASSRREELIIKMLQEEKFLINAELIRRLNDLDKAKNTSMDRKTLERSLNKLQQEGHCKCTTLSIPADTNCSGTRTTNVVLLPSCVISPELLCQIHERFRSFSMQSRQQKKAQATTILNDVQRIPRSVSTVDRPKNAEFLQTSTLAMAKMVQARLLHTFLWGLIHSSPGWDYDSCNLKNLQSSYKMFELHNAIQSIPLGLFSQIIGSLQRSENVDEMYTSDLLLCDIPIEKYRILMDTRATGRLSRLIDILRRLKLIRLVGKTHDEDGNLTAAGSLSYALEFKPYIEEPVSIMASSCSLSLDLRPQVRHDFVLLNDKAVDEYWNTLEYCYADSKPRSAVLAFPGSKVRDVFRLKSWGSSLVMTSEQRVELLKCISKYDTNKKLSLIDCEKISKDLDLTIGQMVFF
ncbi:hypothetical protein M569_04836 [Genlisea aurea]|uniref:Uncharacterized protein n=1 Tax=Genlisea aurea TaxID=192259 RepID=S8CY44_9LAMI|nr:hypothetical protein M569_04836 [Genlisea aurea]